MQRVIIYLGCIAVPILLVPWAKTETAWSLVSFELSIALLCNLWGLCGLKRSK